MTDGLPLIKNILTPLAKSVSIPLALTTAASATDAVIQKKIFGSGTTALTVSTEEMEDTMEIVKSLEESELLIKRISETIKNKPKEQKGRFFRMLLGTIAVSLLESALTGQGVIWTGEGVIRAGKKF